MSGRGELWGRVADLPLEIDGYSLEQLSADVSSGFTRLTTVIRLHGGGYEGLGEDVGYDSEDQRAQLEEGPRLPLAGTYTLASFSALLDRLELYSSPPRQSAALDYRRWAYESAALDLALRQVGRPLHALLGRRPQPLNFVVSLRLGEPAATAPIDALLKRVPSLRFKTDPTPSWDRQLIERLAQMNVIATVDLKGFYKDSPVDNPADPDLYRRVIEGLPEALIEDPAITAATLPLLAPHSARITWDANLHSVADIAALRWVPQQINIKPSRFGPLQNLFAVYEYCEREGIGMYGGGQFELGVGRRQIQYLASIFHPTTDNDVAPAVFNGNLPASVQLPSSPLAPQPITSGLS